MGTRTSVSPNRQAGRNSAGGPKGRMSPNYGNKQ